MVTILGWVNLEVNNNEKKICLKRDFIYMTTWVAGTLASHYNVPAPKQFTTTYSPIATSCRYWNLKHCLTIALNVICGGKWWHFYLSLVLKQLPICQDVIQRTDAIWQVYSNLLYWHILPDTLWKVYSNLLYWHLSAWHIVTRLQQPAILGPFGLTHYDKFTATCYIGTFRPNTLWQVYSSLLYWHLSAWHIVTNLQQQWPVDWQMSVLTTVLLRLPPCWRGVNSFLQSAFISVS